MQLVKASSSNKVAASASTTIYEYRMDNQAISGAVADIHGRYPEKGFAKNEISKELVYVLDGKGNVITPDGKQRIKRGDVVLLLNNELFAWEGNLRLFMATAPKFDPRQHTIEEGMLWIHVSREST